MGIAGGPNILGDENLVFIYDTGDENSYKGEPTTNLAAFDIASSAVAFNTDTPANVTQTANSSEATYKGRLSRKMVVGAGYWNSYVYGYNTGVSSTVFAVSYKIKTSDGSHPNTIVGGGYIYGSAGTFFPVPTFTYIGDGWYLATMLYSGTSMILNSLTGMNGSGGPKTFYITDYQAEALPRSTPFVTAGTSRSVTGSLLDLSPSRTTVNVISMSFDNNAQLLFNGTSSVINPTAAWSYLSSSALECVFRTNTVSGFKTIFGYAHNDGYSAPTIGSIYLNGSSLAASVITATQVYRGVTASTTIATNTFYHVVLNKNTTTGNLDIYVNGTLNGTQTFDSASYGQWPTAGNYIGSNVLDIGKSSNTNVSQGWSTSALTGSIPLTRLYNKVLSSTEILQNYNALKSRFNI